MSDISPSNPASPDMSLLQQYQKALNEAYRFPSVKNFAAVARSFPELHVWNALPGLTLIPTADLRQELEPDEAAFSSLLMGRPDVAAAVILQKVGRMLDSCNSGDIATASRIQNAQYLLGAIISTPQIAQGVLGATLSAVMGADEFEEQFASISAASAISTSSTAH